MRFYITALHLLLFCSVAKDMCSRKEVAALGTQALEVTLGTCGYWREPEGKRRGAWPVWRSNLRAPLWRLAEKDKPVSPLIPNVQRLPGTEIAKSHVVTAAAGVTGDFKTVEQQDPFPASQTSTIKATQIAALVHEPPRRFYDIDKTLIVINDDIFEHLAPETMWPTWLYEEMARADTLICGSQTVVDKMSEVLKTETENRLNDDFNVPRIGNMLRIPIFSWQTKPKAARYPTLFDVRWLLISSLIAGAERYNFVVTPSLCMRPRAMTVPSSQIPNYLTFGPTQVQEMVDTEFRGPLPITHVMLYFDSHSDHLKQTPGFTDAFAFIDHQLDLACKIVSIELNSRMYLLGVSTDSASNGVSRVQNQLNHVLTQESKLDESGDWDQLANWTSRGIPLWVRDEKYGSDACELKEEEIVQKGQAAAAQGPAAKRKSTGEEPAPKKKKNASKPQEAKSGTGEHSYESDGDEEEESEDEKEEEPQVSQGKTAKKAAARPGSEESRARLPFKQPACLSAPREQPAKPPPKGKTSVAKSMGAKMQAAPKKK